MIITSFFGLILVLHSLLVKQLLKLSIYFDFSRLKLNESY